MLLDLSTELLEEIGNELTHKDHGNLRAACRGLNEAMQRLFFSLLTLKTNPNLGSLEGRELFEALAGRQTGWTTYAKTLCIDATGENQAGTSATSGEEIPAIVDELVLQSRLANALSSVPKLRTVVWKLHERESAKWETETICGFLNALADLDTLELDVRSFADLSLLKVEPGVRALTAKVSWRSWRGRRGWNSVSADSLPMYQEITRLAVENRLTVLHLEGPGKEMSEVWTALRFKSQTQLKEITTNVVTPEFFAYLNSYTGVQKLTLVGPDGGNREKSDRLASQFWDVLPRHAATLSELTCPASYESRFSFASHNDHVISLLTQLTSLKMSVNAGKTKPLERRTERKFITVGIPMEADQSDIDPVVALLLQTAASLPHLKIVEIVSAETESNRGAWCGNGRRHHKGAVTRAIVRSISSFRSDIPSAAIVQAGNNTYALEAWEKMEEESAGDFQGKLRYRSIGRG
ncbi:hypothetical protein R3P38DRAFT_2882323 [Favolaschia claudopus]|uniref:F-box domain-containing protein n=1 Tax=Favolaschia claudopus TaxID=2862362 RepID=A0AAW0D4W8_9AGAR